MQRRPQISQSQKLNTKTIAINRLEQNLFSKLDDVFKQNGVVEFDDSFNRLPDRQPRGTHTDLLSKAKFRVNEKQQQHPTFFEEGREKLIREQKKKGTFLITAVNMVKDKKRQQTPKEPGNFLPRDETEMLKELIAEENRPGDDLEELRRMIASTKRNISDYAEGLYSLKGNVQKTNTNARGIGFGVNDMVFDEMDRGFYKYMPQGNKEAIFDKSQRPKSISKERVLKKSATVASRMTFKQRMK